jgi:lipoprotein-anchoring transpeptidase ErfK/SrfK
MAIIAFPKVAVLPAAPTVDADTPGSKKRLHELVHRHSLAVFALLFLIVGASAIQVVGTYKSAHVILAANSTDHAVHVPAIPLQGPNAVVAGYQLSDTVQRIAGQPLNLVIGTKTVPVSSDTIKSWLQVVANRKEGVAYIHVNEPAINKSLNDAAAPYIKDPINQISVTRPDGTSQVIASGRDGTSLGDITAFSHQIGQNVLSAKGMQLTLPVETKAFATTPATDIKKLIEVNVVSKQMYLYDSGQLTRSYPISAGAPSTPTPIGQFKVYSKFAVQDMKGFNADGSKYLQPHVHWINYFLPGGYAVHGNYWRPLSAFGAINSSHGCVSLPDDEAEWVYDWTPIGTTVVTHY